VDVLYFIKQEKRSQMEKMEDELISAAAASKIVGVAPRTLRYWITGSKILPAVRVGYTFAVKLSDVMKANEVSLENPERKVALAKKS